ncbi:prosaposin-like [Mustelus asterias]
MIEASQCNVLSYCVETEWSKPKVDDDICMQCAMFISTVADKRNAAGERRRQLELGVARKALFTYCHLTEMETELCKDHARSVLNEINKLLGDKVTPDVYCALLQMCRSRVETSLSDLMTLTDDMLLTDEESEDDDEIVDMRQLQGPLPRGPKTCDFCLTVLRKLEMLLPKTKSETFISTVINMICSFLPDDYMIKCTIFMNGTGMRAIDLLYEKLSPDNVCNILRACSIEIRETVLPIMECDMCENLMQQLQSARTEGTGVDILLSGACNPYSDISKLVCEDFIRSNKPTLSTLLENQEERDLCGELDLCVRAVKVQLLGRDECTWGPSHLCSDRKIAIKCQAVDDCEKYGWR